MEGIAPVSFGPQAGPAVGQARSASEVAKSFGELLGSLVSSIEQLQQEADASVVRLAAGEQVDVHQVALAVEKARLAFDLALQVRNKVIEAYQEVMRMQV